MVAAEYLSYDPATQKVSLNPEHAKVLADEDSPVFVGGLAQMIPDHYTVIPKVIQAFRDGGGVPYDSSAYDCSSAVSYVLHAGGQLNSILGSTALMSWGAPVGAADGPSWVVVYACLYGVPRW